MNGPIWSPGVYRNLAAALAETVGLSARGGTNQTADTSLVTSLLDGTAETIELENQVLSARLEKDFANPELPYSTGALQMLANIVYDQPDQYEKFMRQAAVLNPAYNYDLGD